MPEPQIRVIAPSRLHFGMLSFGQPHVRQFGGAGAMIDAPGLELTIAPAASLEAIGPLAERALQFARRVVRSLPDGKLPPCRIEIVRAPRPHAGLGSGTQLGLAVAAGLFRFGERHARVEELAAAAGRGERSAIGVHGFAQGGLLVEPGKTSGGVSPLLCRVPLPTEWRFVLLAEPEAEGLSGTAERQAFERLPPVPLETTDRLCRELLMHLLPAAVEYRFDEFSEALYRYGHLAGSCFAAAQGGAFATPRLARRVALIRDMGIAGVGQSSWGPTLFAVLPTATDARRFAARLAANADTADLEVTIAAPNNRGATVELIC